MSTPMKSLADRQKELRERLAAEAKEKSRQSHLASKRKWYHSAKRKAREALKAENVAKQAAKEAQRVARAEAKRAKLLAKKARERARRKYPEKLAAAFADGFAAGKEFVLRGGLRGTVEERSKPPTINP
jgi:hypothetical protein